MLSFHRSPTVLVTGVLLLLSVSVQAQPNPYGCYFFRHGVTPHPVATDADRTQIEETIARSDTFDILHYDIHLDVTNYNGGTIKAATTVSFTALMPDQDFIRFDLFGLDVDSVLEGGEQRIFDHDGAFLKVDFAAAPPVGEERVLTVYYHGDPHRDPEWGGVYFESGYIYNLGIGISTIPPNFGKVWYPCFDSFVERATYSYHVKSTGTYRLHGQGNFIGEVQLGGDTVVRSYDLPQSIPTHISAVAVSDYAVQESIHQGVNGDIPVTLAAKPANLSSMVAKFGDLGAAIDACEYWYGPYAYDRVGYVLTTDGALEIPTNVAYPAFMAGQNVIQNRDLFSHELGHHWWGDVVTPHVHNDMWLKEGPAEYTGHLVAEWLGGHAGLVKAVKDNQLFVLRQAHVNDDGFQALSPMPDAYIYGTHTYYKGAAVMHNLRGYLGDEVFRQAMRDVQVQWANTTITAAGFRDALEQVTGQDLDPFFDAWVFAPGFAAFEVNGYTASQSGGAWPTEVVIGQKLRGTTVHHEQVPMDITFLSASGDVYDTRVVASGQTSTVNVTVPFEPAMVVLNRHARLNQNRMDHEEVIAPGVPIVNILPYVDFRLYAENITDTTLVRVDHIWSGADPVPAHPDVITLSGTHYWNVDGLWPEGTDLRGRLYYYGNAAGMDNELINGNEAGICIAWRERPGDEWEVYADQEVVAGSLTNGTGYINLFHLRKGQYAFGKIDGFIGMSDAPDTDLEGFSLFPVPARDQLTVTGNIDGAHLLVMDVHDAAGRRVSRTTANVLDRFTHQVDVSALPAGNYLLRVVTNLGHDMGTRRFDVVR